MGAAKKLIDNKVLRNFIPINALSVTHAEEISRKADIEDIRSGSYIFKHGDRDYQTVYVLDGEVELVDGKRDVVATVVAGSENARHPLAHKQPRQLGARAVGKVTVARIDSSLLDVLLTWDESSGYDVQELGAQDDGDWMTRMLQSQSFMQLPPSNIHQLLMRLEAVSVSAGDVIVRQGEEGDYFYIVKSGRLAVTRKASVRSKEVLLAELGEGACFGEEALVSGTKRNASVMMTTNGSLMRLSKTDFDELLCASLVHETDFEGAQKLVDKGARWLDVRLPGEFENQSIKGSVNVPLSALREQCQELNTDTDYIACCDTGRRSAAGAFVLSQLGFSVYTLKNGLMDVPDDAMIATQHSAEASSPARDAEILPFDADSGTAPASTADNDDDNLLISKLEGLESDKRALEKQLQGVTAEREAQQARQTELEQHSSQISAERDAAVNSLEQLQQVHTESAAKESELAAQISSLETSLSEAHQTVDSEQEALSQNLESLQAKLDEAYKNRDQQIQERELVEQQLNELKQQIGQEGEHNHESEARVAALESELGIERARYTEAEQRIAGFDGQLAARDKQHEADIGSTREAMTRAQNQTENLKREQTRLMEKIRKLERNLEREHHDHESETHRLRKELKNAAGESSADLEAELDASVRDELEVRLGERSAQVDNLKADSEKLSAQLKQAQESARQAEVQLIEATQTANEEMSVRMQAEEKAQALLRDELAAAIAGRNESQEQFTIQQHELEELRAGLHSANQALTSGDSTVSTLNAEVSKVSAERDTALGAHQQVQQELDQLRAEAEVTRGLVDRQASADENDAVLREELEQAKKNVDVAVRLRGQAEKHAAELETELQHLRSQHFEAESTPVEMPPGHIPSLDDTDPTAATVLSDEYPDDANSNDTAASVLLEDEEATAPAPVYEAAPSTGQGGGKGLVFAVLAVVLAGAGGGWWFLNQSSTVVDTAPTQATEIDSVDVKPVIKNSDTEKPRTVPSFHKGGGDQLTEKPSADSVDEKTVTATDDNRPVPVLMQQQPTRIYSQPLSDGGNGPMVVEFQADSFDMGSASTSANFDERPRHRVELSSFAISKYEITFADYDQFARASGRRRPGDNGWGRGNRPVIHVSWRDATAYAEWLSVQTGSYYRLPTEAEWEFAARSGSQTRFWWGNEVGNGNANCFDCGSQWSGVKTAAAGSFGASAYAVQDMLGNVMEWVQDCYQTSYVTAPPDGSAVNTADCDRRVVRGGGFDSPADSARSASRNSLAAKSKLNNLGFRVVKARRL
ncbi:Serine/threonine protein kinase PrkC, regulator of stationary phase [hydrothermal vent metagenome]|uniref:Serine/threonine protein kinase PrkC, regulator of stationary phase n=1 Tax=hydrothermal vent metagenome TaxID=652676 RepID=A0A3B0Y4X3_9ZZZZ